MQYSTFYWTVKPQSGKMLVEKYIYINTSSVGAICFYKTINAVGLASIMDRTSINTACRTKMMACKCNIENLISGNAECKTVIRVIVCNIENRNANNTV